MPKNPEKKDRSQLSDEEKRELDAKLEEEAKKPKETGWEKFESRQKLIKEVLEGRKVDEEDVGQKEAELTKERKKLPEAYKETSQGREEEVERLRKEAEDELEQKKKASGRNLSDTEIYNLTRNFYRDKLGYEIEYKGLLRGKVRLKDKEEKYVLDEKTRKPIEFKKVPSPEGETPLIKFLKEKYKNNIREGLEKKGPGEKKEEVEKIKETTEKEVEKLMQEKKDELDKKFKGFSDTEKYFSITNFYRNELGYEPKYKGLLEGKARIWDKEKGGYIIDEKTGKPVEFKAKFSPKGETPFRKFLEEEYKNKIIKKDLEKKYQEKAKETTVTKEALGEGTEAPVAQKEEAELEKKPLNASEFFARYLRANDLGEKDITPEKLKELQEKWRAYQKEMGIKKPKKEKERKGETTKNPKDVFIESLNEELSAMEKSGRISPEEAGERRKAAVLIETGFSDDPKYDALIFSRVGIADENEMIEIFNKKKAEEELSITKSKDQEKLEKTTKKLREFFEKFNIEPDEKKRTGADRRIQRALDDLRVGKFGLAEEEISRMLATTQKNLKAARERKALKPAKQYENSIKKLEGFLQEIESLAEENEAGITVIEAATEIVKSAIEKTQENNKKREAEEK